MFSFIFSCAIWGLLQFFCIKIAFKKVCFFSRKFCPILLYRFSKKWKSNKILTHSWRDIVCTMNLSKKNERHCLLTHSRRSVFSKKLATGWPGFYVAKCPPRVVDAVANVLNKKDHKCHFKIFFAHVLKIFATKISSFSWFFLSSKWIALQEITANLPTKSVKSFSTIYYRKATMER